jgi:hypothetical protein
MIGRSRWTEAPGDHDEDLIVVAVNERVASAYRRGLLYF